ncbi:MAG TPA: cobyric acid synthase [Acidimicrobiales bacterium]|nr:cobyric acid synthase [Acidimicrobiales bacterium]
MSPFDGLRDARGSGLMVCGTTSDAGKSFVVAGLCRLLARNGVRVAPFKAQNMANNASVTADGAEIGIAQWIQAVAAGVEPTAAMNPVLLKPTSERTSQVIVRGRPVGEMSARDYHDYKLELRPLVLEALSELRATHDVVICEGAGSPAEINLLDHDLVNLGLADAAGLPALVVGDIDRGGVFAALYGTVALLPDRLRARVQGFVVNRLRGDPALLGSACAELERRCGVPTLGVLPYLPGRPIDAEDSLALDHVDPEPDGTPGEGAGAGDADVLDVVAVRWPLVANAGDLDPLRIEPHVRVRWVRSVAELGRPDLIVLPGSKATRADLDWFRRTGLAAAVERSDAAVVGVCAGTQMCGRVIDDPHGAEGPAGSVEALGWLPLASEFEPRKVLDRPTGRVVAEPGTGARVAGYRIHHGRVRSLSADLAPWMTADDGAVLGWRTDRICATTLHALFEDDGFRAAVLAWAAGRAGKRWTPSGAAFHAARMARLDGMADALESHLDLDRLVAIITTPDLEVTAR